MRFAIVAAVFFMLTSNASAHRIGFECLEELEALGSSASENRKALLSFKDSAGSLSSGSFDDIKTIEKGGDKEIRNALVLERHKRLMTALVLQTVWDELLPALKQNNKMVLAYLDCAERYRSD